VPRRADCELCQAQLAIRPRDPARESLFRFGRIGPLTRNVTDQATSPDGSAYSPELRRRSAHLTELAASIERSLVMTLADGPDPVHSDPEGRMCRILLERNLHQLHRAADDLRSTALRFRARADELDAAVEPAA
jgi:hypothetical protein